jgi:hypothetical protein
VVGLVNRPELLADALREKREDANRVSLVVGDPTSGAFTGERARIRAQCGMAPRSSRPIRTGVTVICSSRARGSSGS